LTTMYRAGHSGVVVGGKLWLLGGRKQVSLTSMETLAIGGKEWKPLGYNSPWKEISPGTQQWNKIILTCKKTISQIEYNSYRKPYFGDCRKVALCSRQRIKSSSLEAKKPAMESHQDTITA